MKVQALSILVLILAVFTTPLVYATEGKLEAIPVELGTTQWGITIDGDPSEWGVFACPNFPVDGNYGVYYYVTVNNIPQWIWCDAPGDERTDFSTPDKRVDLVQFRITGDSEYIYMLFILNDTSGFNIGDDGGTFVAITINRNGTGYEEWFAGVSETKVNTTYAKWLYQVVVNLADSRYRGQGLRKVTDTLHANWGGIFYLVDYTWSHITDARASIGADVDKHAIEIRIPWSLIGGTPSGPSFYLRISLITGRGWSNHGENSGGTWNPPDGGLSDALDAMTIIGPNTWHEVEDGIVDYYVDVYFTTTPPYYPIPEPGVLVALATISSAGGLTAYLLKKHK